MRHRQVTFEASWTAVGYKNIFLRNKSENTSYCTYKIQKFEEICNSTSTVSGILLLCCVVNFLSLNCILKWLDVVISELATNSHLQREHTSRKSAVSSKKTRKSYFTTFFLRVMDYTVYMFQLAKLIFCDICCV